MRIRTLLFAVLIAGQSVSLFAQNDLKARFDSLSLNEQFEYVYDKSENLRTLQSGENFDF